MKPITIKDIQLHVVSLPYVEPLRTSFGVEPNKVAVLVELTTENGITGWGEAAIEIWPGYGYETVITCTHILEEFVIPKLIGKTINQPQEVPELIKSIRGHNFAKFSAEAAVWDAFARANDMRLADCFASFLPEGHESRGVATVGVSIGIQPTVEDTVAIIQKRMNQGYLRIKLKIKRGWDVELARGIREALPDISLMLDANSDYTLADADHLAELDEFNLLMIEQPLAYHDIYQHSKLQARMTTPICLDESIKNAGDLELALAIGACKILNLKPCRVGGYTESLKIYNICVETGTPLWIGGMLETGVGRAANTAFASLPGVTLPCDISATDRYYNPDITEPPFVLGPESTLKVPDGPGIGVEVQRDRLIEAKARWQAEYPYKRTEVIS